jgi:WD40 repeat protein
MTDHWHEQVRRYADGLSTAEESASLEKALVESAELRAWYLDLMNLEVALGAAADAAAMTRTMVPFEVGDRGTGVSPVGPAGVPPAEFPGFDGRDARATTRRFGALSLAAAAAVVLGVGLLFWMGRSAPAIAHLEQVQGEVVVAGRPARSAQRLFSGDGLRVTGEESSATIVFVDGTRLAVGPETVIAGLSDDRGTGKRVVLSEGFLSAEVAKQPAGRPMILATPQSEVVVIGTVFNLSSGTAGTHLETQSGHVRLNRKSDGRSVEVPAGFEGTVDGSSVLDAQLSPPRFTTDGCHLTTALSPDGRTLATSRFQSGIVTLWDAAGGRERMTLPAHVQQVVATAFSPDSRTLATGDNEQIKLWDVETGRVIAEFEGSAQLLSLAFAKGGASLLAFSGPTRGERTVTEWNVATRERRVDAHKYPGEAWLFSPSGRLLATSSVKGASVTLWDLADGSARAVFPGFPARVTCLAISPDESLLAIADVSGRVEFWSIADAQRRLAFNPAGQSVHGLAFSPDGRRLALGQRQATVRLWDVVASRPIAILQGPRKPGSTATVRPMFFSQDGRTLATTESQDTSTVRLWELPPP